MILFSLTLLFAWNEFRPRRNGRANFTQFYSKAYSFTNCLRFRGKHLTPKNNPIYDSHNDWDRPRKEIPHA